MKDRFTFVNFHFLLLINMVDFVVLNYLELRCSCWVDGTGFVITSPTFNSLYETNLYCVFPYYLYE